MIHDLDSRQESMLFQELLGVLDPLCNILCAILGVWEGPSEPTREWLKQHRNPLCILYITETRHTFGKGRDHLVAEFFGRRIRFFIATSWGGDGGRFGLYWLYIFWDNLLGSGFQNLQASLFNLAGFLSSPVYTMVTCKIAIEIPRWKMFSRWPGKTSCSKWGPLHVVYHPGLNKFGPSPFRSLLRGDIYSRMVKCQTFITS